jgi:hypothetical protein
MDRDEFLAQAARILVDLNVRSDPFTAVTADNVLF